MRISGTVTIIAAAGAILASAACTPSQEDFTKYVDPTIGTGGHGHVFYGASVPFGLVQLGPTSIPQDWDWTSGYHISDSTVIPGLGLDLRLPHQRLDGHRLSPHPPERNGHRRPA